MAEMTFDGTFSDLKLKVASETAIQAIYPELVKLNDFSRSFDELEGRPGESIVIASYLDVLSGGASDFVAGSNDYGSGQNTIGAATVTLDKHLVASIAVSDRDLAATGINWVKQSTEALAKTMGRSLNAYVMGLVNATNCPLSAEFNVGTKAQPTVQKLYQIAVENGLDVGDSVVVLNPQNFTNLLGIAEYAMYGDQNPVKFGFCDGLFGFRKIVCSDLLSENVDGFIANYGSIGIASRYLEPMAGAYPMTFKAVDPDSGFTMGFRLYADLPTGTRRYSIESLIGARVLMPNKIVRLVNS